MIVSVLNPLTLHAFNECSYKYEPDQYNVEMMSSNMIG